MSRGLTLLSIALAALVAGGATYVLKPAGETLAVADVRAIVDEALAAREAQAPAAEMLSAGAVNPMIETYLVENPQMLERMANALEMQKRAADAERVKGVLIEMQDAIYNDPDNVIVGNPEGDVTLVELFDYNCGYCRRSLPDLVALLEEDPKLRIILKELPILSDESIAAARIAVAASRQAEADTWGLHQALFSTRGQVSGPSALQTAANMGMNPIALELQAAHVDVTRILQKSFDLADALGVSGTPTFIIGDEIIPGAIGIDELRSRIANMRACGSTSCTATN